MSDWEKYVGKEAQTLHNGWRAGGKTGAGRMDVADQDLTGFRSRAATLSNARFVRCKLDGIALEYSKLIDCEFIECSAVHAILNNNELTGSIITMCNFTDAELQLVPMTGIQIRGGDFSGAAFGRARLNAAQIKGVRFRNADFGDAKLDQAHFADCDFQGASLALVDDVLGDGLCTAVETRFERCDFRGVDFTGRRLKGTLFDHCKFHGIKGKPMIQGPYRVIAPDFSAAGDGSDERSSGALATLWGGSAS